ncbi:hypothetical protein D1872_251530 [compost metagenome]
MQQGDNRRYGKSPFKTNADINDNAQTGDQDGINRVARQFLGHFRIYRVHFEGGFFVEFRNFPLQFHFLILIQNLGKPDVHPFLTRAYARFIRDLQLVQNRLDLLRGDSLAQRDVHVGAGPEVDAVIQPEYGQANNTGQGQSNREYIKIFTKMHVVQVFKAHEFHSPLHRSTSASTVYRLLTAGSTGSGRDRYS